MLALLHDPDAPHGLRLGETAEPEAGPGQVLVEVRAVSLNFGDLADVAPVDFVLDNVGGPLLATAVSRLTPGGLVLSIGQASLEPTTLDFEDLRMQGGATLEAFGVGDHFAADLATLLALRLDPRIGWRGSWEDVHAAIDARVAGKAILEVTS